MGTTRIKVIDLSSDKKEVKTSRKHAQKLAGVTKVKEEKRISDSVDQSAGESANQLTSKSVSQPVSEPLDQKSDSPTHRHTDSPTHRLTDSPTRHRGKKYQEAANLIDKNKSYPAADAIELLYKTSITKFDPTVEVHLNVSDKNLKTSVNFPHAVATKTKKQKFLVFADKPIDDKRVIMADAKTIEKIEAGQLKPKRDFDAVFATPKFMPALAKIAKILGPAGMMPNPKNQTVTNDPAKVVKSAAPDSGFQIKTEQAGPIIHTKIGKLSNKPQELSDNLKALIFAIGPTKIQKTTITSTMGPGIKVDLSSISLPT